MSTNARSWFYEEPEHVPYAVVERLNGTFWQARVTQLLFTECTQAEPPFKVRGFWRDEPLELEWVPNQWLTLRSAADLSALSAQLVRIVGFGPELCYDEGENLHVYEWHRAEAEGQARWRAIQGKPEFRHPERLSASPSWRLHL